MQQVEQVAGVSVIATRVDDASPKELRSMVDELKRSLGSGVVLLISVQGPKVALAVGVTADLTGRFRAGDLAKQIAERLGGSGGGRPDFAQAGGNRIDAIPEALNRLKNLVAAGESTSG